MIRWVFVIFLGLLVFTALLPWMQKLGVGKVWGDVRFKLFGQVFVLPFGSAIVVSALAFLLARLLQ